MNSKGGYISLALAILFALGLGFFVWQNAQLKEEIVTLQDTVSIAHVE